MATSTEFSKPLNQDMSEKADKVSGATDGDFAGLDSNGNLTDSGKKASDFVGTSSFYATELPMSSSDSTKVSTAIANKINTSDIANNLTTTAEGKVLDARQGKALSDTVSGKVSGPSSVTADRVAVFNGTSGKVIKDSGYTIAKSVPSNADFTNTWRGIQNNLTSTSTTDSLSAAQGKILNESIANKSKIQTTSKTVTITKGAGSIAKTQIPGTVISAYMTDGWKVAVSQNGSNYSVLVFSASNGTFTVYPNDNWGVSITFVYY